MSFSIFKSFTFSAFLIASSAVSTAFSPSSNLQVQARRLHHDNLKLEYRRNSLSMIDINDYIVPEPLPTLDPTTFTNGVESAGLNWLKEEQQDVPADAAATEEAEVSDDAVTTSSSVPSSTAVSPPIDREINAPSVAKILKYTIPAIGGWLCSPVLSMIDTAFVGLLSETAQQAALNPAVSITDIGALVVAFMYTATTNLIASAQAQDQDDGKDARYFATHDIDSRYCTEVGTRCWIHLWNWPICLWQDYRPSTNWERCS